MISYVVVESLSINGVLLNAAATRLWPSGTSLWPDGAKHSNFCLSFTLHKRPHLMPPCKLVVVLRIYGGGYASAGAHYQEKDRSFLYYLHHSEIRVLPNGASEFAFTNPSEKDVEVMDISWSVRPLEELELLAIALE